MISKCFTSLIVFFPLLSIYETFVPRLSYADFFLVFFVIIFIFLILTFFKVKQLMFFLSFTVFLFVVLIFYFVQLYYKFQVEFLSTIRYLLYILTTILGYRYFDKVLALKLLRYFTLFLSFIVVSQFTTFYFFGYIIPWNIPYIPVVDNSFIEHVNSEHFLQFYRPTGLFYEPTHFAQYAIVYLIYIFTSEHLSPNSTKKYFFDKFLIITAILLCASSLGFVALLLIIIIKYIFLNKRFFSLFNIIFLTLGVLVLSYLLYTIDYFSFIISRVYDFENFQFGPAFGYRFDSVFSLIYESDIYKLLVGSGRGSEDVYFTGVFYIINSIGLIGLFMYFIVMFAVYKSSDLFGKYLISVVFLLSFGSEFVANFGLMFYTLFSLKSHRIVK